MSKRPPLVPLLYSSSTLACHCFISSIASHFPSLYDHRPSLDLQCSLSLLLRQNATLATARPATTKRAKHTPANLALDREISHAAVSAAATDVAVSSFNLFCNVLISAARLAVTRRMESTMILSCAVNEKVPI